MSTQEEEDAVALHEKKRARRRLVGTIALLLAAVVVVPIIFDAEPQPVSRDILIDIPPRAETRKAAADKPASDARLALPPVQKPAADAASRPPPATVGKVAGKPPAKRSAPPPARDTEKYAFQVAAFSSQEKAEALQARLKKAGLKSYTQKAEYQDGSVRIRVRVGPLLGKRERDGACAKLKDMNLPCTALK